VTGRLTLHGRSQTVTFTAGRQGEIYLGEVSISQRDFGIRPISIVGGTVRVRNEVTIRFEIVPSQTAAPPSEATRPTSPAP
jgi:hypothetical protein